LESISGTEELGRRLIRPILTIGNFDGVHVGHRAIMETIIDRARRIDGESVVLTFDPHPRKVLQPGRAPSLLITREQKLEVLEAIGIDVVIFQTFDLAFSRITPEAFIREVVYDKIRPVEVFVGYDFHFGRDREGSMNALSETGADLGFSVTIIPEVKVGNLDVNSTRIRKLLEEGSVEEVEILLGRPFSVRSLVLDGERRGRTLGFPTANLSPDNEILPQSGVYAGEVRLLESGDDDLDGRYPAVVNVGKRPTFHDDDHLLAEAHILDFDRDIYGQSVELSFRHRLRAEQKFPGPAELKVQIAADVEEARRKLAVE
jgi:riboflavin kinase/FMN adenylyltransferase